MIAKIRLRGSAKVTFVLTITALMVGGAGGFFLTRPSTGPVATDATGSKNAQWYTCGMHPNVLQEGPGDCPICQMKLTPLKTDQEGNGADDGGKERQVIYWRAPMDPNYVSDKPGRSPMGMELVPVYADESASTSVHAIQIDPVTIQNMGIRTTTVERGSLSRTVRTVGHVDYDEQGVTFIDTKFSGWIEKLHVDETGQRVDKGDPLFEVYSPELYTAQMEYLAAVRNLPRLEESTFAPAREQAARLVDAARTKLAYLDVSDDQIDRLRTTGKVARSLTIHSPATGIVTEKMALRGMYVKPGMRLFTIADLSRVWVYVDIFEYQLAWVHVGQTATITLPYIPGKAFVGRVVYVYPYLEPQTRVIKVRLEFENPTMDLKPGMFTNVTLESESRPNILLVPRESYIDSGTRKVIFVYLGGGKFAPRDLQVGVESEDGMVEVLYGVDEGEVIVTSGQFLLDGESKLKEAVAKMMKAQRASTTKNSTASRSEESSQESSDGIPPDAKYSCPMDKHPDAEDPAQVGAFFSTEPGRCPACGMKLKPLDELEWVRVRRAADGGDVAYTCPDHQHVFSDQPDTCPRCGQDLMLFKAMYTCPDPQHADVISKDAGNCPHCSKGLAAFRGVWLDEAAADLNLPDNPGIAKMARYRCAVHPLVHSDREGACTICAAALLPMADTAQHEDGLRIPHGAKFTCPMQECEYFSKHPGECPVCGMKIKPLERVAWTKSLATAEERTPADSAYVCPMHPDTVRSDKPGTCSACGMQMVAASSLQRPTTAPEHVAAQTNYILEHYLEIQRLLASDRTTGLALNALGLVAASETLAGYLQDSAVKLPPDTAAIVAKLHAAALKTTGNLASDRVALVDLSAAVVALVERVRPDRKRWPKLYIYHCPMSKGDWLQATEAKANPYYGFKMLSCGVSKGVR